MSETVYKVKVVIPLYRSSLDEYERLSVCHNLTVLNRYPAVFVMPEGVEAPAETEGYDIIRVGGEWLGTSNGIAGYNRMMLSHRFYDLFADCEYILVCQTDTWIFRDELEYWCDRGFDCTGAPWPRKPLYDNPLIRLCISLRRRLTPSSEVLRTDLFDRTGNGGLSLRRVRSFRKACQKYAGRAGEFNARSKSLYNEDVFWALVPQEFSYPSAKEARHFSIDLKPEYSLALNDGRLPFGCHGWFRPERIEFWRRHIGI